MHMDPVERGLVVHLKDGRRAAFVLCEIQRASGKSPAFRERNMGHSHALHVAISGLSGLASREAESACGGRDSTTLARR